MTILACVLTVIVRGSPQTIAMSGTYVRETESQYVGNFGNAMAEVLGHTVPRNHIITVDKDDCIKEVR